MAAAMSARPGRASLRIKGCTDRCSSDLSPMTSKSVEHELFAAVQLGRPLIDCDRLLADERGHRAGRRGRVAEMSGDADDRPQRRRLEAGRRAHRQGADAGLEVGPQEHRDHRMRQPERLEVSGHRAVTNPAAQRRFDRQGPVAETGQAIPLACHARSASRSPDPLTGNWVAQLPGSGPHQTRKPPMHPSRRRSPDPAGTNRVHHGRPVRTTRPP